MRAVDLSARGSPETAGPPKRELFLFDQGLPGFGLRIHPSGREVWVMLDVLSAPNRTASPAPTLAPLPRRDEMALPQPTSFAPCPSLLDNVRI